jgi:hypothetical protein
MGEDLLEYLRGHRDGIEAMKRRNQPTPFNAAIDAAGAIQHAVTVTRPDPSRAEIAMRLYPALLRNFDETVRRGECGYTPGWREGIADEAVKHADALRSALEKPKP